MFFKKNEKIDELIKKIENKNLVGRYFTLLISCLLVALAFNLFFLPINIVYGGVSGVSIIMKKMFDINPSIFILIVSSILLVISFFTLGWEKTKGSIAGSILFPICISLTTDVASMIDFNIDNKLLLVIFGAIIAGLGSGMNFKTGFSTGGTDIINQIVAKYCKVSIGKAMIMSDGLILLGAGFFLSNKIYAFENVMYAIIVLYIISIMADKVILGISQCKTFYIVTDNETKMKRFIMDYLSHGVTVLDGRGGFTGNHQKVIMCTIPTKDYFLAKEGILGIDPNAFFLVTDAYEVSGGSVRR